ncbi:MAG: NlpC/P60 family protein [Ancrocorticia sp.]|jgi:cell wall-associated NlpC family hydrolase|nr:NlpC/P60 family protein [Ancrocorticia sp.]MCI2178346.1 NlpC/P60 family protein [Ancrocorticia sp.]MCI2193152.1 NlpC/P60 family protein [Ancrocorticia sp.]MCI2198848.1 NlpC/P60 family protein [Ancrocorticia sp.]
MADGIAAIMSRTAELDSVLASLAGNATADSTESLDSLNSADSADFTQVIESILGDEANTATAAGGSTVEGTVLAGNLISGLTGQDLVESAMKYLGTPYVWGGEDSSGVDCSGLVQLAFADLGILVPRVAADQGTLGVSVGSLAEAEPGDLLIFRNGEHIGIYLGNNQMIHAPQPGETVEVSEVYNTPTSIRRVFQDAVPTTESTSTQTSLTALLGALEAQKYQDYAAEILENLLSGVSLTSSQKSDFGLLALQMGY